ncbi:MAG: PIN domain-containing protein [Candidatus Limnocylindrales bacterium]
MIELWDTSALILAARGPTVGELLADAVAADELAVNAAILLEYLNGARNVLEYDRFDAGLGAARLVDTTAGDWDRALSVHRSLAASGPGHQRSVRLVDLIVAATAERHGLAVVHYDEDYDRIAAISGQTTRWIVPRGSA